MHLFIETSTSQFSQSIFFKTFFRYVLAREWFLLKMFNHVGRHDFGNWILIRANFGIKKTIICTDKLLCWRLNSRWCSNKRGRDLASTPTNFYCYSDSLSFPNFYYILFTYAMWNLMWQAAGCEWYKARIATGEFQQYERKHRAIYAPSFRDKNELGQFCFVLHSLFRLNWYLIPFDMRK